MAVIILSACGRSCSQQILSNCASCSAWFCYTFSLKLQLVSYMVGYNAHSIPIHHVIYRHNYAHFIVVPLKLIGVLIEQFQNQFSIPDVIVINIEHRPLANLFAIFNPTYFSAGHITNSLTLVADSFHMLSDALSLVIGLAAVRMSKRTAHQSINPWWSGTEYFNTFGWVRFEVSPEYAIRFCVLNRSINETIVLLLQIKSAWS